MPDFKNMDSHWSCWKSG